MTFQQQLQYNIAAVFLLIVGGVKEFNVYR